MTIYGLTSFSASPGVTTTAIAWANLSPRPTLIVEADTRGGSPILAGVWAGQQPHTTSILELANRDRDRAGYVEFLHERTLLLPGTTDRRLLPAIPSPEHAHPLASVWRPLAAALRTISSEGGVDVVIDAGRLSEAAPWVLLETADSVLVFTDTTLAALNTAVIGLKDLRSRLEQSGTPDRVGLVPVTGRDKGPDIRPYGAREIQGIISPTSVVAEVHRDADRAAVYGASIAPKRGHGTSGYVRSIVHLVKAGAQHAHRSRAILQES